MKQKGEKLQKCKKNVRVALSQHELHIQWNRMGEA